MMPIVCPLEIRNVGGIKIRYKVNEEDIVKFNTKNDDFPVFKLDNCEGPLSPGEVTYIIGAFRPLTNKNYTVEVPIEYSDGINGNIEDKIILKGHGYNPGDMKIPKVKSNFLEMPKNRKFNFFENNVIQKCGINVEEIDFGSMEDGKSSSHTVIIYNYSDTDSFNFEFFNPGFNMKDELIIEPLKGRLGPNSHLIIKVKIVPRNSLSNFEGELEIKIFWLAQGESKVSSEKENLYIRVSKQSFLKDVKNILNLFIQSFK